MCWLAGMGVMGNQTSSCLWARPVFTSETSSQWASCGLPLCLALCLCAQTQLGLPADTISAPPYSRAPQPSPISVIIQQFSNVLSSCIDFTGHFLPSVFRKWSLYPFWEMELMWSFPLSSHFSGAQLGTPCPREALLHLFCPFCPISQSAFQCQSQNSWLRQCQLALTYVCCVPGTVLSAWYMYVCVYTHRHLHVYGYRFI